MTTKSQIDYIQNPNISTIDARGKSEILSIPVQIFCDAIKSTNEKIDFLYKTVPDLFDILGMRNLSAVVGEIYVRSFCDVAGGLVVKNPHQDGYPDLLLMTSEGKNLWDMLSNQRQDKSPFSNFVTGGIEMKATCGSVPTPEKLQKKGVLKPVIGDLRIGLTNKYDWKAHHRETNNLIGLFWDFIELKPIICGVFYSGNLTENDWGNIVRPKPDDDKKKGRTTSVSIMTPQGIKKMYDGWVVIINDRRYADFFDKRNQSTKLAAMFPSE